MNNKQNRKRGSGMKSYRVQYDNRTDEEIKNWTYEVHLSSAKTGKNAE